MASLLLLFLLLLLLPFSNIFNVARAYVPPIMLAGHFSREIEAIRIDVFVKAISNAISLCAISRNAEGISLRIIRAEPRGRYATLAENRTTGVSGSSDSPKNGANDEISPEKIHYYEILRAAYDYGRPTIRGFINIIG